MSKETKVKVLIAKSDEGSFAYKQRFEDGTLTKSEPIALVEATQLVKSLGLTQESKIPHDDGTTRYTYA